MAADREPRQSAIHRIAPLVMQAVGLGILWVLFSGKLDALHLGFGVVSIALVLIMTHGFVAAPVAAEAARSWHAFHPGRALLYVLWLSREIIIANIDIARIVLSRHPPIDPVLVRFRTSLPGRVAKVALGNSITLTPGTLTLGIQGRDLLVHAITEQSATSPVIAEMERRLAAVLGCEAAPPPTLRVSRSLPAKRGAQRP